MTVCKELAPIAVAFARPDHPTSFWDAINWDDPISLDTEAHECEREAFVYEMFAQHYLQDAWSTGHMWYRWGSPELSAFPDRLGSWPYGYAGPGPDDVNPSAANIAARRYTIAALTGAFAGTIHGAKGVTSELAPWFLNWTPESLVYPAGACGVLPVGPLPTGSGRWRHADLAGNVMEWALDWFDAGWYSGKGSNCNDCSNITPSPSRVFRGGGFGDDAVDMRAAHRRSFNPTYRYSFIGLRCARAVP